MSEETFEVRAKEMGWAPKEEFRGDPEKWIDAETYVKRGEELMPILRANNRKLQDELGAVKAQLAENSQLLTAAQDSIEALKDFNSEINRAAVKEKVGELREAIVEARNEGNVDKEFELSEQLREQRAALKEAEKAPEAKAPKKPAEAPTQDDYTQNPDWKAWTQANEWFGKDKRKTALAMGIADELKSNPATTNLSGRAFLDKVSEEVETVFGGPRQAPDKVEGGGSGSKGGNGKSFADLPREARDACERQANRLVGAGRAFKTAQDWRNHYAKQYFSEE